MPGARRSSRSPADTTAVAAVRSFNRFYTRQIGVLNAPYLQSDYSLAECRALYELAQRETMTATEVGKALDLDPGYLSRIVRGFHRRGLIARQQSEADGRQSLLRLTAAGRRTVTKLDGLSGDHVAAMLDRLPAADRARLVAAMHTIEGLLGARPAERTPFIIRPPQPGDMGWVAHRHGALYAEEYGFDESFEALVAQIVAEFVLTFDPKKERCWIAEQEGEIIGSIFLVKKSATVAKLRLLYVEPKARGLGVGRRLVAECIRQARLAGYKKMTLWTQSNLHAARRLYEEAGFHRVEQHDHHSWGCDLTSETWDLKL